MRRQHSRQIPDESQIPQGLNGDETILFNEINADAIHEHHPDSHHFRPESGHGAKAASSGERRLGHEGEEARRSV